MKPLFWFKVIKGVLFAVAVTLGLLCIFSLISVKSDDPSKNAVLYANASLFLGAAFGGGISSRGADSPFIASLVCGGMCSGILLFPSIVFSEWGADSLLRISLTVVAAIIGGFLLKGSGANSIKKQSAKRRREIAKKYGG